MTHEISLGPVSREKRVFILDLLRGFALLGILMVNMPVFNSPFTVLVGEARMWTDPANQTAHWIINFFFHGKFYTLFSILFGIGFWFFMRKAEEAGGSVIGIFRRRLLILFLIGALHVLFLWYGDILVIYAFFGFIMTWLRNKSNRTVIVWAIVFLLLPVIFTSLMVGAVNLAMSVPEAAAGMQEAMAEQESLFAALTKTAISTYQSGSFSEIVSVRLREYSYMWGGIITFYPLILSMFLLGIIAGRKGVFNSLEKNRGFFIKLLWISLPFAIGGNYLLAEYGQSASQIIPDTDLLLMIAGLSFGGPALTFIYISLTVFCILNGYFSWIAGKIAGAGRMALTNYLMQSVICTTIFYSYGLGLYARVDYLQGIALTLAIYIIQVAWSHYWLKYYRFGPFEWLWRSLTYLRLQPMKRRLPGS